MKFGSILVCTENFQNIVTSGKKINTTRLVTVSYSIMVPAYLPTENTNILYHFLIFVTYEIPTKARNWAVPIANHYVHVRAESNLCGFFNKQYWIDLLNTDYQPSSFITNFRYEIKRLLESGKSDNFSWGSSAHHVLYYHGPDTVQTANRAYRFCSIYRALPVVLVRYIVFYWSIQPDM